LCCASSGASKSNKSEQQVCVSVCVLQQQQQLQKSEPVHNRKKQNKNNNNKKRKNSKRWLNRWQLYKSLLAPFLSISIILIIIIVITTMLLRCSLHVCSRASSEVHGHPKIYPLTVTTFPLSFSLRHHFLTYTATTTRPQQQLTVLDRS